MPDAPRKFYLTTPIYYVNARPHIGHAYTTIAADVIARRHRLLGEDTYFLTGTDEHGQKIERSAAAAGVPPQQFADGVSRSFEDLWKRMGITNNDYIRTTEPRHKQGVRKLFQTLQERGAIYLSTYTGQYCVSDEAYVDGPPGIRCPDCGRLTETVSEENFYFKLSEFQRPLLDLIESNTLKITPEGRRNEVLSFLRGNVAAVVQEAASNIVGQVNIESIEEDAVRTGKLKEAASKELFVPGVLKDLSVSRTSFTWGIPVPGNEKHVVYVWLDALANYMTALGYGSEDPAEREKFDKFWPADLHLVGKEIIRFHCVYWPAFLLAMNPQLQHAPDQPTPQLTLEQQGPWIEKMLPKAVTAHGWLLFEESKMSKSRGNIVRTETILDAFGEHVYRKQFPDSTEAEQDLFATDVLRYFLLREIPFGQDGSFSFDALIQRYNSDLANGYGNLVSRTLKMIEQSFKSSIPGHAEWGTQGISIFEMRSGAKHYQYPMSVADTELARLATVMIHFEKEASLSSRFSLAVDKQKLLDDLKSSAELENEERGALDYINLLINQTDQFISAHQPWKLVKSEVKGDQEKLSDTLYQAAESIRIITALLYPILPFATAKVWAQLGLGDIELASENGELRALQWGGLKPGTKIGPLSPIFPRADKSLAQVMADIETAQSPASNAQNTTETMPENTTNTSKTTPAGSDRAPESAVNAPKPADSRGGAADFSRVPRLGSADEADTTTSNRSDFPETPLSSASGVPDTLADDPAPELEARTRSRLLDEASASAPAVDQRSFAPGAAPRTGSFPEQNPIAHVAGSSAPIPELHRPPSHTEAPASGPFATQASAQPVTSSPADASTQITIDDFAKVELRVAEIKVAERIPKADKLLRLEVDLGYERRQILSGIAEWYTPEQLIGRRIVVITNLAPRKMRGLESHGMLLAASDGEGGKPILATFGEDIALGSRLR